MTDRNRMQARRGNQPEIRTFQFDGDMLPTFEYEGEPWVAMRPIVEALGIDWGRQSARLNAQKGKFSCWHMSTTGADGKSYRMTCIPAAKLPLWLASINPNKIKDKARREKVERYQEQSAIALHDFWTKGVAIHPAVKDDLAGVVTDFDPRVMQALGGMVKGIVGKALNEVLPQMVQSHIASQHYGLVQGVTSRHVSVMAGLPEESRHRKGLKGLTQFITSRLRRFCAERGVPVKLTTQNPGRDVYVFDKVIALEWLRHGGEAEIKRWVEERRGQGRLRLVGGK